MLANYGYNDGSGEFYITINTDKCDGCGKCVEACPARVFEVGQDEFDPMRDEPVASVIIAERKRIKYTCAPCKPTNRVGKLPCELACKPGAITHSW